MKERSEIKNSTNFWIIILVSFFSFVPIPRDIISNRLGVVTWRYKSSAVYCAPRKRGRKKTLIVQMQDTRSTWKENVYIMIMVFSLYIRLLVSTGNNTVLHFARFLQNLMRSNVIQWNREEKYHGQKSVRWERIFFINQNQKLVKKADANIYTIIR